MMSAVLRSPEGHSRNECGCTTMSGPVPGTDRTRSSAVNETEVAPSVSSQREAMVPPRANREIFDTNPATPPGLGTGVEMLSPGTLFSRDRRLGADKGSA